MERARSNAPPIQWWNSLPLELSHHSVFSLHLQACFARNAAAETASEKKKEKEEEEIERELFTHHRFLLLQLSFLSLGSILNVEKDRNQENEKIMKENC